MLIKQVVKYISKNSEQIEYIGIVISIIGLCIIGISLGDSNFIRPGLFVLGAGLTSIGISAV